MNLKSPSQPLSFRESILSAKSKPDTVPSVEGTAGNQINKDPCPMELSLQWMRPEINKIIKIYGILGSPWWSSG